MTNKPPKQTFFNISVEIPTLGGDPVVEFVEIVQADIRYRASPRQDLSLEGSLDRRLAKFVKERIDKVTRPRMVMHEPEASISLPHVTLSNLQTLVSVNEARCYRVLVRFSEMVGNPQSVLRASVENVGSSVQDVAVSAYEHVFQSGLALTEASLAAERSAEHRPELHGSRKRLESNINTLLFKLDLLKRHVSRADMDLALEQRPTDPVKALPAAANSA